MEQINIEEDAPHTAATASGVINTTSNLVNREKRVRKPKQYDNDYLLYDTTISLNKTFSSLNQPMASNLIVNRFQIGDLVWAKLSGHPWWPCMIANGPNASHPYRLMGGTHRQKKYVYVEFFGPTIEHAWISEASLIDYRGVDAFKIYAQNQVDQASSKSAKEKLADKFQLKVSLSKRDHWEKAVQEADYSINISVSERLELFNKKLNELGASGNRHIDSNNNRICDHMLDDDSQMSNGSGKRKLNVETVYKKPSEEAKPFDTNELISTHHPYQMENDTDDDDDDDENNSLTLSKILLDVANSSSNHHNTTKSELNDYFIEQLASQPEDLMRESKIKREENEENLEDEGENDDDDDVSFNSEDIEDEEDTSDENYSDVEKINKKKQSVTPRMRTTHSHSNLMEVKDAAKRTDVINAFGLRERKIKKTKRLKEEELEEEEEEKEEEGDENDENLESDVSTGSYVIYQPDHNRKPINPINATPNTKRTYTKSSTTTPKKYKNKKQANSLINSSIESLIVKVNDDTMDLNSRLTTLHTKTTNKESTKSSSSSAETYLIDRYKYAVRHIRQGLSVEEACNKYRISKGALLKCLSGGTAPRGKKTRLTELEENEIVEWLINNKDLKYNEAIHLVFEQVEQIFQLAKRPNPFHNGKPSMDWWYDFLSRHPQIMASKPEWLRRGKVNDQYIRDVQSGKLRCTKFRRALLSAIQYIRSLTDAAQYAAADSASQQAASAEQLFDSINSSACFNQQKQMKPQKNDLKSPRVRKTTTKLKKTTSSSSNNLIKKKDQLQSDQFINYSGTNNKENKDQLLNEQLNQQQQQQQQQQELTSLTSNSNNYLDRLVASLISDYADISDENDDDPITSSANAIFTPNESQILNCLNNQEKQLAQQQQQQSVNKLALLNASLMKSDELNFTNSNSKLIKTTTSNHLLISDDQDDEDYHLNDQVEEESEEDEVDEEDEEDDDDEDGQTHITTLNEFA